MIDINILWSLRLRHQGVRSSCSRIVSSLSVLTIMIFFSQMIFAEETEHIDMAKISLEKWIETQRIISKEKRDLELSKEMLTERIELCQSEIDSLRGKITNTEASIDEADKKRTDMVIENDKLKESSDVLGTTLNTLEERLLHLLPRLPDPIRDRVKPLSQRIPSGDEESKQSIAERFQNIVGILNEIEKFNRDISITSEVRDLPDGSSAEVTALYVGMSCAFYSGANGKVAGIGNASDVGWVWGVNNKTAEQVSQAIAIMNNEQIASFVQLPIEIQ